MALNFDPYEPKQYKRLRQVVKYNYRELKPFRDVRQLNIEAARGHYYRSKDDPPDAVRDPVNMMDQFVQILVRSFVQSNPTVRVTSRSNPKAARIFQEHLNITIQELDLLSTLRRSVQEAILGYMGLVYCGITTNIDPGGDVFADSIPLPDFVVDLAHDEFSQADIMGHRFARRKGELLDDANYDQEQVAKMKGRRSGRSDLDDRKDRWDYNEEQGSLFDWVDIWSILVQPANVIVYLTDDSGVTAPLRAESYDGPEFGPYPLLGFDRVLDELMPNSRAAMMLDTHDFVNGQYRRIFMKEDQAAEFYTYEGGAEEDARQIRDAMDGGVYMVNSNNAVTRRTKGGTNPQALATAIHGRQLFDELSGNLRLLGGVGPIAETATQERLANVNASRLVRDMQLQVVAFTKKILQNIAWYEWTHPTRMRRVERKVGRNGTPVSEMWSPEIREGDFIEHEIDIVPDSMEHRSSAQQLEHLIKAIQTVVIPAMQMPSERPVVLKTPELLRKYSELDNLPELAEVVDYAVDDAFVSAPAGGAPRAPVGAGAQGPSAAPARSAEDALVERMFSGTMSNKQEDEG
ncbi:hypothetical protein LCGC14_0589680 [marine sediment metagenome]|uniref:Portal protein n=1 Tax=marine sediment metagenome TaxID=412755 RepID=A0A0F9RIT8_9ZZZZ